MRQPLFRQRAAEGRRRPSEVRTTWRQDGVVALVRIAIERLSCGRAGQQRSWRSISSGKSPSPSTRKRTSSDRWASDGAARPLGRVAGIGDGSSAWALVRSETSHNAVFCNPGLLTRKARKRYMESGARGVARGHVAESWRGAGARNDCDGRHPTAARADQLWPPQSQAMRSAVTAPIAMAIAMMETAAAKNDGATRT
jgi:hypothetical protein